MASSTETSANPHKSFSFAAQLGLGTSYADLLAAAEPMDSLTEISPKNWGWSLDSFSDRVPKFNSTSPISHPSSLSFTELLDSPAFFTASDSFNWSNSGNNQQRVKDEETHWSDFSFDPNSTHAASELSNFQSSALPSVEGGMNENEGLPCKPAEFSVSGGNFIWNSFAETKRKSTPAKTTVEARSERVNGTTSDHRSHTGGPCCPREQRSDDGYNWRKYGQKQVKGSQNPRSYYKCTFPNCPTRKKLEKTSEGQITEIVYKGTHNHPKPQSAKRSSVSHQPVQSRVVSGNNDHLEAAFQMESIKMAEKSSVSLGDNDFLQNSQMSKAEDELDDDELGSKRRRVENENEYTSTYDNRAVREPRVVVQTTSDVDFLDDGYRWRKYGQKVVKGNPNPRSYYKCTHTGCCVRKHVERASNEIRDVITTYEGKHNHDIPIGHRSNNYIVSKPIPNVVKKDYNITMAIHILGESVESEVEAHKDEDWFQEIYGDKFSPT